MIAFSDKVGSDVNAQLHGTRQIQCYHVLGIGIAGKFCHRLRGLLLDAFEAKPQGLELLLDYLPIHACLRSARMRRRYGRKSASSKRWRVSRVA